MFSVLKPRVSSQKIAPNKISTTYKVYRVEALLSAFLGYLSYYIVRNNFTLSTPYLKDQLHLETDQIGILTSLMLISYGISKGVMSNLSDKASPKRFMALGLILCAIINIGFGFCFAFWMFFIFVILNGLFQGMGVGPSFITISNWFPRSERGRVGAFWNISHNVGGGIVAPIVTGGFTLLALFAGNDDIKQHWQIACYWLPALIAIIMAVVVFSLGKESPVGEGLPPLQEIVKDDELVETKLDPIIANMSSWQIFVKFVLPNKNAWFISFVDVFVYMVRFGVISWLPIYLSDVKHFTKQQMSFAFLCFEWAAIPSTLLAGWLSDKYFKGRRMPLAILAMTLIFFCIIGYWQSNSLIAVIFFAAIVGCLIYIPQFLASVQTMEIVPSYAVGSAVGLRGFMSYILGASLGAGMFGFIVKRTNNWDIGFYMLLGGTICCIIFCLLSHFGALQLEKQMHQNKETN